LILLSIITPTFNPGHWLENCILNVSEKLPSGVEHLIIDGGSSDGTVEKLVDLEKKHPHLRWISEKDKGQSDAMNKGLSMAAGSWVGFLNADDFYEPDTLSRVLACIRKNPFNERFLFGNLNIINEKDELISVNKPANMSLPALLADVCEWPYNPASYFYPLAIHDKIGKFPQDEHFAMDYDFILKLMSAQIPIEYHNETWGNFRLLPETKTGQDQASNLSYQRAKSLRHKYTAQAEWHVRASVYVLKFIWAIRNKVIGTGRKLMQRS
jgi:glycosyltransferase involved in cell wall biosynthesis